MTRVILAVVATIAAALTLTIGAAQPLELEIQEIADNLYVLTGPTSGGNTAIFVTNDGVVLVDSKLPGLGPNILEYITFLTDNPVTTLINTHSHLGHVGGNAEFSASVDIIAHAATADNMRVANLFPDSPGLPTTTFSDQMAIGTGDDMVALYHFGPGHTAGDTWVVFPAVRAAHSGDIFPGRRLPFIDVDAGGSGLAIADTLQRASDNLPGVDIVITGHSAFATTYAELSEYAAFNP